MLALLIMLAAAPPPKVERAMQLVNAKKWDELMLSFATAKRDQYGEDDQRTLAQAFSRGCDALSKRDAVLAQTLAEKAIAFSVSAEALWCASTAAKARGLIADANQFLREGLEAFPDDPRWPRELPSPRVDSSVRDAKSWHFRFRYFAGGRDFGQRSDYEHHVRAVLEDARAAAQRSLGVACENTLDAVLYTREEFGAHFGSFAAANVAGFYAEKAIRLNDSADLGDRNRVVLAHEYVHAVVDELAQYQSAQVPLWLNEGLATWVEWSLQGSRGPPPAVARRLAEGTLPSLASMAHTALIAQRNPTLAYAFAGLAVGAMIDRGGMPALLRLIRQLGAGESLAPLFNRAYGKSLDEFEQALDQELKR